MSQPDKLTVAMQNKAISIVEMRLEKPLAEELKEKLRLKRWSYMGLEMIIDTVETIELTDLERYIRDLDK